MNKINVSRKLVLIAVLIIFGATGSWSSLPWDDQGIFESGKRVVNPGDGLMFPLIGDTVVNSYVNRFGALPGAIIWEDYPNNPVVNWSTTFKRWKPGVGKPVSPMPWGDTTRWVDLKDHLRWKLEGVKSDSIRYVEVKGIPNDKDVTFRNSSYNGWYASVALPLRDLPIGNDSTAWVLKMVVFEDTIAPGKEMFESDDWITIVRTNRETAVDTFIWADTEDLLDSLSIINTLLPHFPESQLLLEKAFYQYEELEHCDSLRSVAGRLYYYMMAGIDPLVGHPVNGPDFMIAEVQYADSLAAGGDLVDYMQAALYSVCGDSTIPAWQP